MGRMTTVGKELEIISFAQKAADVFSKDKTKWSYGDLTPESYLALKWGLDDNCVLVLKLDSDFEPINYQGLILESIREQP